SEILGVSQREVRRTFEHADDAAVRALADSQDRFLRVVDAADLPAVAEPRAQMRRGQKARRTGSDDGDSFLHDGQNKWRRSSQPTTNCFEQLLRTKHLGSPRRAVLTLPINLGATMSDSSIDRRTILSATLAWAAATLSGCSSSNDNGGSACGTVDGG